MCEPFENLSRYGAACAAPRAHLDVVPALHGVFQLNDFDGYHAAAHTYVAMMAAIHRAVCTFAELILQQLSASSLAQSYTVQHTNVDEKKQQAYSNNAKR